MFAARRALKKLEIVTVHENIFEIRTLEKIMCQTQKSNFESGTPEQILRRKKKSNFDPQKQNSQKWKIAHRIIEHFHFFGE